MEARLAVALSEPSPGLTARPTTPQRPTAVEQVQPAPTSAAIELTVLTGWQAAETAPADNAAPGTNGEPAGSSNENPDETNVWPDANAESAFLAETRERGEPIGRGERAAEAQAEDRTELPPLDELVARVPPQTRELIDELFRARFVAVRRVRQGDLKPATDA